MARWVIVVLVILAVGGVAAFLLLRNKPSATKSAAPTKKASAVPIVSPAASAAPIQTGGAPPGPFEVFLEPALNGPGPNSPDCRYRLGLRLNWPQSPPYKEVAGKTVGLTFQRPEKSDLVQVTLEHGGQEYIDELVLLTKSNGGTYAITIDTVGGEPIASYAGPSSKLTNSTTNPCVK